MITERHCYSCANFRVCSLRRDFDDARHRHLGWFDVTNIGYQKTPGHHMEIFGALAKSCELYEFTENQ